MPSRLPPARSIAVGDCRKTRSSSRLRRGDPRRHARPGERIRDADLRDLARGVSRTPIRARHRGARGDAAGRDVAQPLHEGLRPCGREVACPISSQREVRSAAGRLASCGPRSNDAELERRLTGARRACRGVRRSAPVRRCGRGPCAVAAVDDRPSAARRPAAKPRCLVISGLADRAAVLVVFQASHGLGDAGRPCPDALERSLARGRSRTCGGIRRAPGAAA